MNRTEYFQQQKELVRAAYRAETESVRRIRAVTRELVVPLVKQYTEQGMITFPKEELARRIDHIIREEGAKPVAAARKLQEDMERFIAEKLHIEIAPLPAARENKRTRQENAPRKAVGTVTKVQGRAFAGYSSGAGAAYYRDPQTGKIVWTDIPIELAFRKREDLSSLVWSAVEEQEEMIFDVVRGGRAAGRNVKDIAKDLETFINFPDGGKRVVGRWQGMFPNTEAGRRAGWEREYLTAHGGLQPGSDAAKAILREADARQWVAGKMAETTKRKTPRLPPAVRQYASRLGKAGLDYRAIRIARTETTAMLADEQTELARNSAISDGKMDFVMDRGRDHWNCNCEKYAAKSPWDVDDPARPEIPVHPNCMCQWRIHIKTDEEIEAEFKAGVKEAAEETRQTTQPDNEDTTYQLSGTADVAFNYDLTPNRDQAERQYLSDTMKERGVYADFDESKKECVDYIPILYDNAKSDFPSIGESVKTIGYSKYLRDFEGAYFNPVNNELIYNKNVFASEKNIEEYLNKVPGHFASTNKHSLINHEIGHGIEHLLVQLSGNKSIATDEVRMLLKNNGIKTTNDVKKQLSGCAADKTLHETIAEAVSDCLSEKNPREISKLIYNKLLSIYWRFA